MPDQVSENKPNPKILKLCREQVALSIETVQKKAPLKKLEDIEKGKHTPTFKQMDRLSELYLVPPWVFMKDTLPEEYNFGKSVPSFRKFKGAQGTRFDYKLRSLVVRVETFRKIIIELREELEDPLPKFSPPSSNDPATLAASIRTWLDSGEEAYDFDEWRRKLEQAGVFVFVTSPFKSWSKIETEAFRGLSIYYDTLPIIIINGSDVYKAKSFTLFHELGHLIHKKTMFDQSIGGQQTDEEKFCDNFAGETLMPRSQLQPLIKELKISSDSSSAMKEVKKLSDKFKTSVFATIVRLSNLQIINQSTYRRLVGMLKKRYDESKAKNKGGIARNIPRETLSQYGRIYSNAVMQAYFNKDITLYKARNMFGIKKAEYVLEMAQKL